MSPSLSHWPAHLQATTTVDYFIDTGTRSSATATTTAPTLPDRTRVVRAGTARAAFASADGTTWRHSNYSNHHHVQYLVAYTALQLQQLCLPHQASAVHRPSTTSASPVLMQAGARRHRPPLVASTRRRQPAPAAPERSIHAQCRGHRTLNKQQHRHVLLRLLCHYQLSELHHHRARRFSIANGNTTSRAGVTIRETTATGSKHTASVAEKAGTARSIYRVTTTANTATLTLLRPYWLRLKRLGDVFSA